MKYITIKHLDLKSHMHFVVHHKCKHVEKSFPTVAIYTVFVGKFEADLENHVSSIQFLQKDVFIIETLCKHIWK